MLMSIEEHHCIAVERAARVNAGGRQKGSSFVTTCSRTGTMARRYTWVVSHLRGQNHCINGYKGGITPRALARSRRTVPILVPVVTAMCRQSERRRKGAWQGGAGGPFTRNWPCAQPKGRRYLIPSQVRPWVRSESRAGWGLRRPPWRLSLATRRR